MYSLDINFLNDRPEYKPDAAARTKQRGPAIAPGDKKPFYIGLAAGIVFPLLVAGLWLFLQARNNDLTEQQAALDKKLGDLENVKKQLETINSQTQQIKNDTSSLATAFNLIKPWSALAQDLRERTPPGIQVFAVKQVAAPAGAAPAPAPSPAASPAAGGAAAPAAAPAPTSYMEISGQANNFNDVNDFLLTLQRSTFLQKDKTSIVTADRMKRPPLQSLRLPKVDPNAANTVQPKPVEQPDVINFTIRAALSDAPPTQQVRELDRKGAVGIVSRIEALKEKGVIQP